MARPKTSGERASLVMQAWRKGGEGRSEPGELLEVCPREAVDAGLGEGESEGPKVQASLPLDLARRLGGSTCLHSSDQSVNRGHKAWRFPDTSLRGGAVYVCECVECCRRLLAAIHGSGASLWVQAGREASQLLLGWGACAVHQDWADREEGCRIVNGGGDACSPLALCIPGEALRGFGDLGEVRRGGQTTHAHRRSSLRPSSPPACVRDGRAAAWGTHLALSDMLGKELFPVLSHPPLCDRRCSLGKLKEEHIDLGGTRGQGRRGSALTRRLGGTLAGGVGHLGKRRRGGRRCEGWRRKVRGGGMRARDLAGEPDVSALAPTVWVNLAGEEYFALVPPPDRKASERR